jgi:hypothetical protein
VDAGFGVQEFRGLEILTRGPASVGHRCAHVRVVDGSMAAGARLVACIRRLGSG